MPALAKNIRPISCARFAVWGSVCMLKKDLKYFTSLLITNKAKGKATSINGSICVLALQTKGCCPDGKVTVLLLLVQLSKYRFATRTATCAFACSTKGGTGSLNTPQLVAKGCISAIPSKFSYLDSFCGKSKENSQPSMLFGRTSFGVGAIKTAGKVLIRTSIPILERSAKVPNGPGKNEIGNKKTCEAAHEVKAS